MAYIPFLNNAYFSAKVGIGTTSPGAKLEVAGDVLISSGEYLSWGTAGATSIEGSTASNKLQFRTSSADRMIITSSGKVGIGTTNPQDALDIDWDTEGVATDNSGIRVRAYRPHLNLIDRSSYTTLNGHNFQIKADGAKLQFNATSADNETFDLTRMVIDKDGKVGIGTTSPGANLDILNGTTGASLKLSATATAYWQLQRDSTTGNLNISDDALGNVMSFDQLTGNVGIGTTSPGSKLEIAGANSTTNATALFSIQKNEEGYGLFSGLYGSGASWLQSGTADGTIDYSIVMQPNGGNVGIGTTSPRTKLEIGGSGTLGSVTNKVISATFDGGYSLLNSLQYNVNAFIGTDFGTTDIFAQTSGEVLKNFYTGLIAPNSYFNNARYSVVQGGAERLTVVQGGNVGIGTTNPGAKLDVRSTSRTAPVVLKLGNGIISGDNGVIVSQIRSYINNSNTDADELARIQVENGSGSHDDGNLSFWTRDGFNNVDAAKQLQISGKGVIDIKNDGTALLPVLIFGADVDTGFFRPSSNNIALSTSGVERIRVNSGGNVGIGTTSPTANLYVSGSNADATDKPTMISESVFTVKPVALNSGNLSFAQVDSGNSIGMQYTNGPGTANWDISMQPFGGNVGIGTTSPARDFVVSNGGASGIEIQANYQAGVNEILSFDRTVGATAYETMRFNGGDFQFQIGGTEIMRMDSAGAIKFNAYNSTNKTGTPTYLLGTDASGNIVKTNTVPGSAAGPYLPIANPTFTGFLTGPSGYFTNNLTTNGVLTIQAGNPYIQWNNAAGTRLGYIQHSTNLVMNADSGQIVLNTAANNDILINPGGTGNVGIGTTSPVARLDVKETTSDVAGEIIVGGLIASDNVPFGKISFANTATANTQTNDVLASIAGEKVGSSNRGELTFLTSDSAAPVERMRIGSDGNVTMEGALNVAGVSTLANVGYLGDGLGSVQYTLQSANDGYGIIDFGDVADVNIGRLSYNHNDNSFLIRTNNATALTLDSSQNATFAGSVTAHEDLILTASSAQQNNITSNTTLDIGVAKSAHNAAGYTTLLYAGSPTAGTTNNIAGGHLYLAAGGGKGTGAGGDIIFRVAPVGSSGSTLNAYETALTISDDKSATFQDQAFSAATSSGDASSTLTTKGYVDGLITGATIYRGAWQAGISATSSAATTASTTLTVTAAILDEDGNTPVLVGAVVTGAGITGIVKVASVTSSTVYVLDTAITATATAYIFSPIYGAPDLSGVTETSGYYYICSEAGSATPNGANSEPNTWNVGDWCIYNDVSGTGQWQKIDNSSVLSGAGTGQTVALWEGPSSVTDSETLGNAPITVSGNDTTFAGAVGVGVNAGSNAKLEVASATGEVFRADSANGAFRLVATQTGVITQGVLSHTGNATFSGDVTVSGGDLTINSTGNAVLNVNGTANSFIEKDTGTDLYIANNVGDKDIIFRVKDDTTNVIALTLDGSEGGNATFSGDVSLADNKYLNIGASNDLKIHHNSVSTDSFISETGLGDLYILSNTGVILKSGALGENYANFTKDGPIELYYDNSKKFETSSAGISVAGSVQIADDTDTAVVGKVGTMRYRTGTDEPVPVTGIDFVTNGNFVTDSDWIKSSNATISGGQATLTANSAAQYLVQGSLWPANTLSGQKVLLTYIIVSNSLNAGDFRIGGYTGASAFTLTGLPTAVGTHSVTLDVRTSAGDDNAIDLHITSTATSGALVIDNVSVMEVTEEDASYADMCMQTGASTYEWVNIVRNTY